MRTWALEKEYTLDQVMAKGQALEQGKDSTKSMGHNKDGSIASAVNRVIQDPDQVTERDLDAPNREARRIRERLGYPVKGGDRDDKNSGVGDKCAKCCGTHKDGVKC